MQLVKSTECVLIGDDVRVQSLDFSYWINLELGILQPLRKVKNENDCILEHEAVTKKKKRVKQNDHIHKHEAVTIRGMKQNVHIDDEAVNMKGMKQKDIFVN